MGDGISGVEVENGNRTEGRDTTFIDFDFGSGTGGGFVIFIRYWAALFGDDDFIFVDRDGVGGDADVGCPDGLAGFGIESDNLVVDAEGDDGFGAVWGESDSAGEGVAFGFGKLDFADFFGFGRVADAEYLDCGLGVCDPDFFGFGVFGDSSEGGSAGDCYGAEKCV